MKRRRYPKKNGRAVVEAAYIRKYQWLRSLTPEKRKAERDIDREIKRRNTEIAA